MRNKVRLPAMHVLVKVVQPMQDLQLGCRVRIVRKAWYLNLTGRLV